MCKKPKQKKIRVLGVCVYIFCMLKIISFFGTLRDVALFVFCIFIRR